MIDLALSLVSNPTVLLILGAIGAAVMAFFRGRSSGKAAAAAKQAEAERKARKVADEIDNDVDAMGSDAARKELERWGR